MTTLKVVPDRPARLTDLVAAEVRAQMARIRMTQTQLAASLGLPQSAVSNRLRGKVAFSVDELQAVAETLGVHPAVLLGGAPGNTPEPPSQNTDWFAYDSNTPSYSLGRSPVIKLQSATGAKDGALAPVAA